MSVQAEKRSRFLADILITAIEGGIGYWSQVTEYTWECDPEGVRATIHQLNDDETGYDKRHEINLDVVARGLNRIIQGEVKHLSDRIRNEVTCDSHDDEMVRMDSDSADCVIQAALFGDIVYG